MGQKRLDQLQKAVTEKVRQATNAGISELLHMFKLYDRWSRALEFVAVDSRESRDGTGYITADKFMHTIRKLGIYLSSTEVGHAS